MPKVPKSSKATAARTAAHPTSLSKSASSKKKKKSSASTIGHSASLVDDIEKLNNPGKLKPISAAAAGRSGAGKAASKEDVKLENQLLLAGKTSSAANKKKKTAAPAQEEADMEDDDDDEADEPDFGDESGDEAQNAADDAALISARLSKKILQQAHAQQREEEDGEGAAEEEAGGQSSSAARLKQHISLSGGGAATADDDEDLDDEDDDDEDDEFGLDDAGGADGKGGDDGVGDEVELSAEDASALDMFMPSASKGASGAKGRSLAENILDKIREKEALAAGQGQGSAATTHGSNVKFGAGFGSLSSQFGLPSDADALGAAVRAKLDPKIVDVYTKVGKFLSHYTSGKVPKAFKLVPNLRAWEEVLFLTNPDGWSAQAHLVATRIFASNLNPKMAQRFYSLVLLPKIRSDIEQHKHLNFHLYQAIKKALYKPAAFFKGLLLPLAEEGATAREAVIMASILAKCTIPVLHASVALLKLTQMPFSGTSGLFLRTIINKKYSLPRKVLAACVQYFCGFLHQSPGGLAPGMGACPLIWHQSLLVFVQRYKNELTQNQVAAIRNLVKVQQHHAVTAEIRRELLSLDKQAASSGASAHQFSSVHMQAALGGAAKPAFTSLAASLQNPESFNMGD